jgi:aminoglycoside/choline kinase family phosphotransferase
MSEMNDARLAGLHKWVQSVFPCDPGAIVPLAGDASFRRYFRITSNGVTRVAVDAPPTNEKSDAFVGIAQAFAAQGIQVPAIIAADQKQGYMLLSDLGDGLFSSHLSSTSVDPLYISAIDTLIKIQQTPQNAYPFPQYDESLMLAECNLFSEWYLGQYLKLKLSPRDEAVLHSTFARIIEVAQEQPKVVVHRDYHSRNLLVLPDNQVGVLDFQDAVIGPITYDLVSLLKDCYVSWPNSNVVNWAHGYFEKARAAGIVQDLTMPQFLRWFDWMGVQRHLKCIGIFARLYLRDNKSQFLADIPQIFDYILATSARHPKLNGLSKLLQSRILKHEGPKHESNDTRSRTRKSAAALNE